MLITDKHGKQREYDGDILPDGFSMTVPMTFMDAAQKAVAKSRTSASVTDAYGGTAGLHRPGARYAAPSRSRTQDAVAVTLDVLKRDAYRDSEEADRTAYSKPNGAYPLSAGEGNA